MGLRARVGRRNRSARRSPRRVRWVVLGVAVGLLGLGVVTSPTPPRPECGGVVEGDVVLDRDLVGCEGHGVRLAPFAKLDCAGHEIRAASTGGAGYGVVLEDIEESVVRNCRIAGFARGIRVRGGRGNVIAANEIAGSRYGIEVAQIPRGATSESHRITGNRVRDSLRAGIRVGAGAKAVALEGNLIDGAGHAGIALAGCRACVVHGNSVQRAGRSGLDVKDSVAGDVRGNTISGSVLRVRGRSERNLLEKNRLVGAGYVFAALGETVARGRRIPAQNRVVGGAVLQTSVCFRFRGARDNEVLGVEVDDCRIRSDRPAGAIAPSGNRISEIARVTPG